MLHGVDGEEERNVRERIGKQIPKSMLAILVLGDILIINLSGILALLVRFDFSFTKIESGYIEGWFHYTAIHTILTLIIFFAFRLYASLWSYASVSEFMYIAFASMASFAEQIIGMWLLEIRMPRSFYFLSIFFMGILVVAMRFSYRFLRRLNSGWGNSKDKGTKNVMLIGAGEAGSVIIREINSSQHLNKKVCCVIDDDKNKIGKYIQGIKIIGDRGAIVKGVEKYNIHKIIIAMPTAPKGQVREILDICQKTKCDLQILPGVYQLIDGEVSVSKLRSVEIEDLLGRESIKINEESVLNYVSGQVVMVTGGGGSIGSELCRQIAAHNPKQLIIFDVYENNAYEIQQELKYKYPELNLVVLIGSVRNTHRINDIISRYRPSIMYHAAAHKHVPLMEDSPNEAIKNNVFGTYKTATAAGKYGVKRFVLISTDKAVNPTNIMGASKRMCEMIVQMLNRQYDTEFVAVRFGNVLGSNGSVIPLFKKQIEHGGPVTVTDPDIIRYFMTIPEAVSLVLQAGAFAKGGEIFVLDMGEPVKIVDLATNLIRLSGYVPGEDIEIEYTGLRPGEKLYEELLMEEEGMKETGNHRIHIGKPIDMDDDEFLERLMELDEMAKVDSSVIRNKVGEIVSTYICGDKS